MPRRSPVRTTDALFVRAQPQDCEIDQSRNSTDGAGAGRRGGRMRLATSVVGTFRTCPDSLTMFEDTVSAVVEYGGSEVDPTWNYRDKHQVSAESLRSGGAGLQRHGSIVPQQSDGDDIGTNDANSGSETLVGRTYGGAAGCRRRHLPVHLLDDRRYFGVAEMSAAAPGSMHPAQLGSFKTVSDCRLHIRPKAPASSAAHHRT